MVWKFFSVENFLGPNIFLYKQFLGWKNILGQKRVFGLKSFCQKKLVKKISAQKISAHKIFQPEGIFRPIFWSKSDIRLSQSNQLTLNFDWLEIDGQKFLGQNKNFGGKKNFRFKACLQSLRLRRVYARKARLIGFL